MQNIETRVLKLAVVRISNRAKWRIKLEYIFILFPSFGHCTTKDNDGNTCRYEFSSVSLNPALPEFLRSSGSGTESTQSRECN
jgi:hypothetical protein